MMTDPIADMITRIRNAVRAHKETVEVVPKSNLKIEILKILKKEGYIEGYKVEGEGVKQKIIVFLKYDDEGNPLITDIQKVSKPGRRIYVSKKEIPWVANGIGVAIISSSKGLITDREARRLGVGGEYLLYVV